MGRLWTSIASIAAVIVAVYPYSAAAQAPECFSVAATIIGTDGADELTGTAGHDVIVGLGGIDVIRGGGGDDILCGGAGTDRLIGGADDDLLNGGAGRDSVAHGDSPNAIELDLETGSSIGWGSDTLVSIEDAVGSPHDDVLIGDSDGNRFQGGAGADEMYGSSGDDFLGAAHRTEEGVFFGECTDLGRGPDLLVGGDGADELFGCGGEDIVRGSRGGDRIEGGRGDDDLEGGPDDDHVSGGSSISEFGVSIHCRPDGSGSDRLSGQGGNDTLLGCNGSDRIRGGSGNDLLSGGDFFQVFGLEACTTRDSRRDRLEGGHGRDELWGCGGGDLFIGGGGRDTALFSGAEGPVVVRLHRHSAFGEGRDRLRDIENITGSEHSDTIFGNRQANVLRGGMHRMAGGSGEFYSGRGRDRIFGRAGNDVIIGGLHDDQLDGGGGRDRAVYDLTYDPDRTVVVDLSLGTSSGAEGSDEIERIEDVTAWFDTKIVGNDGPNRLVSRSYYGPLDGVLIGRGGRDVLLAGLGDDVVRGGGGRDVLDGGPGRDRLYGGPDLDRCKSGAVYRSCEIRS